MVLVQAVVMERVSRWKIGWLYDGGGDWKGNGTLDLIMIQLPSIFPFNPRYRSVHIVCKPEVCYTAGLGYVYGCGSCTFQVLVPILLILALPRNSHNLTYFLGVLLNSHLAKIQGKSTL